MPLGTLDRTPPPFFRQGPSALTKLVFFSALALFLMVADGRFEMIQPLRAALAVALAPVQQALAVPVRMAGDGLEYLNGLDRALASGRAADARMAEQSARSARVEQLLEENRRLRALLDLAPQLATRSIAAEVMYEAADPFSRKVFVDRGQTQGVALGAPVINDAGVLGQVTRLYPLSAEVTLLVDQRAVIPVLNTRTQQRSVAFGGQQLPGGGALELRFLSGNADVQTGDSLVTSGLDGVYPPGLPVAQVASVDRRADSGFARVLLQPAARADAVRHVLLLEPLTLQLPPRPAVDAEAPARAASRSGVGVRR